MTMGNPGGGNMPLGPSTASEWPYKLQPFEHVVYPSQHRALRLKSTFGNAARGHHGGREANVWHLSLRATAEGERGQKKMTLL